MPITFNPNPGTVLRCDFSKGFVPPEMVKKRLVVTISHRSRVGPGLCTVVPISTTAPIRPMDWHFELDEDSVPPPFRNGDPHWVKCDMIYTVSLSRLDRVHHKPFGGNREYLRWSITEEDLESVRAGVASYLSFRV